MSENWTKLECEIIVDVYFQMLFKELCNEKFNKAEFNKNIRLKLVSRTKGSVEYKHQNISAILLKNGCRYIKGYKPAFNYQSLLEEVVIEKLIKYEVQLDRAESKSLETIITNIEPDIQNLNSIFVNPPEKSIDKQIRDNPKKTPRHIDYLEREKRNASLGKNGEEFVLNCEKARLKSLGREDLINDIEWTSQVKGDGAGYDIRSFYGEKDIELFIEVKTTNSGKYQPFYITQNEVMFSGSYSKNYSLYRVFDFNQESKIFKLEGKITDHVNISPRLYEAAF